MAAEQVLGLLDTNWFETSIFTNKAPSLLHSTMNSSSTSQFKEVLFLDTKLLRIPTLQVRSFSEENLSSKIVDFSDSQSPNSVLTPQKLKPILSSKEVKEFSQEKSQAGNNEEVTNKRKLSHIHSHRTRFLKGKKSTKSMSDLEFKELKGFMDLGFVFCEEDKDSRLVSLIPGLQMLGKDEESRDKEQNNIGESETMVCWPYLSEAWGVVNQKKVLNPLLNWRVPVFGNEIDMKDNLKFWAHTVASIVR